MKLWWMLGLGLLGGAFGEEAGIGESEVALLTELCGSQGSEQLRVCRLQAQIQLAFAEMRELLGEIQGQREETEVEAGSGEAAEGEGPSEEKRKSPFLRLGKRKSPFLRLGKRKSPFLRLGKRKSPFLRFRKDGSEAQGQQPLAEEKRKSPFLRF